MRERMNGWNPGVEERIGYYVYVLIDPGTDQPFYVGKGTGGRCFGHIRRARRTTSDTVGDYAKLRTIRAIEEAGHNVRIEILRHGLDESTAFHVEAAAIDLLGLGSLHNLVRGEHTEIGMMSVTDINANYGAVPVTFDPSHRLLLIRINRKFGASMSDRDLYEATRAWWKARGRRRDRVTHALAVYNGVVRAVYKIDEWVRPTPEIIADDPTIEKRWAFNGHRDPEMEAVYLLGDVTAYLPRQGGQNPIRYIPTEA